MILFSLGCISPNILLAVGHSICPSPLSFGVSTEFGEHDYLGNMASWWIRLGGEPVQGWVCSARVSQPTPQLFQFYRRVRLYIHSPITPSVLFTETVPALCSKLLPIRDRSYIAQSLFGVQLVTPINPVNNQHDVYPGVWLVKLCTSIRGLIYRSNWKEGHLLDCCWGCWRLQLQCMSPKKQTNPELPCCQLLCRWFILCGKSKFKTRKSSSGWSPQDNGCYWDSWRVGHIPIWCWGC